MTKIPTEIISLAFEGGYKVPRILHTGDLITDEQFMWQQLALDREFWICLGKALEIYPWQNFARQFYDLILSDQDPTEWWTHLTANK